MERFITILRLSDVRTGVWDQVRIKNESGEKIEIEPGEELVVKRYLIWVDDEREIDYLSVSRTEGDHIVSERERDDDKKEEKSDEVREMIDASPVLNRASSKSDESGESDEPDYECHYTEDGERCNHPCKNLRGLKIHWGRVHKDKEFYLPEEEGQ